MYKYIYHVSSNEEGDEFLSFLNVIGLPTKYKTERFFYRIIKSNGETGGTSYYDKYHSGPLTTELPSQVYSWGNTYTERVVKRV